MLIPSNPQVLKTCPFCGGDADPDIQGQRGSMTDSVWTFIRCKRRCRVSPQVGESCPTGYHDRNLLGGEWITTKTEQEAADLSYQRAASVWNERHE